MTSLEERYRASFPILDRLGRADSDGIPITNAMLSTVAPDLWRMIGEACFGVIWNRPGLTLEHRSMATISVIAALRRDDNLRGHVASGLDVGFTPAEIVEMIIQTFFYVGAPIGTTALDVANSVFEERGLQVEPIRVFDPDEDPEAMQDRGRAKRQEILGDIAPASEFQVDQDWDRYLLEYLWGSVWTRPGLDTVSRMVCTLSVLPLVATNRSLRDHVQGALRIGMTEDQINEIFFHLTFYTGESIARHARVIAREVFSRQANQS
ncbi:MAG: carboxymuconolactone decarboxylase family protein [Chloroflexi bacterium]|nr:carboxymuconolactone decarboxylase family protein [Chloroflexota bacterium]